jgi:hypothetical protein
MTPHLGSISSTASKWWWQFVNYYVANLRGKYILTPTLCPMRISKWSGSSVE